jgi:uncharacterized membrane protein
MKRQHMLFYVGAAAVLLIGGAAFGFSTATLFAFVFLLLCPLMMFFMMSGMHDGGNGHDDADAAPQQHPHSHPGRPAGDDKPSAGGWSR